MKAKAPLCSLWSHIPMYLPFMKRVSVSKKKREVTPVSVLVPVPAPLTCARPMKPLKSVISDGSAAPGVAGIGGLILPGGKKKWYLSVLKGRIVPPGIGNGEGL